MAINLGRAPYLDRFNPENQWTRVGFIGDRSLQASELNETQSILHHYLGRLGDSLMADGDIQSGMDFRLDDKEEVITIGDGEIYFDGKVRTFEESSIPFDGEAEEFFVCVGMSQDIITEEDDESLLDQNTGTHNYFSPGAHRLKEELYLTPDTTKGVPIYEFREGELFLDKPINKQLSQLNDIMAERTYDESGSYRVNGFDIFSEEHPTNETLLNVVVDSGRAYVQGYQVDKPTPTRIPIKKATDTNEILSEAFIYDNIDRRGKLGNSPVAEVTRVTAQVPITRERVSKGYSGEGMDRLSNTSVNEIKKIWTEVDGVEDRVYKQGRDYQLRNGDSVEWIRGGNEPSAGVSYYVNYTYFKTMRKDVDYEIKIERSSIDDIRTYIDFSGLTGSKPEPNSSVLVDYKYYLAREDLIVIDKEGEITITTGQPEPIDRVVRPELEDPFSLQLGSIILYPNSTTTIPTKSTVSNLTMQDLQNLRNRIVNVEYNQALNALDKPAMGDVNPLVLRGVFSDGFISTDKYDSGHPDARIGFSFEDAEITLPYKSAHKKRPDFVEDLSDSHIWGRLVTAPFTEERLIFQDKASATLNINPYMVYNNRVEFKLNPSEDNWVSESSRTVSNTVDMGILDVSQWWRHPDADWAADAKERQSNIELDQDIDWGWDADSSIHGGENIGDQGDGHNWRWETDLTTTQLQQGGSHTKTTMLQFMREIDVEFTAKNLLPMTDNLKLFFDGKVAPITPASGFQSGAERGTIRSNAQGIAKGSFTIPGGVRTGTREVILENSDNIGLTTFIGTGSHRDVTNTIIRKRQTVHLVDPLAQSFQLKENRVVTSFDVYFASKDNTKNVGVQVRGIADGGQPNKTVYAETTLTPSQINTSEDASVPTNISFDDPLVVEAGKEYALVLLTNSDQYTIWKGTRGGLTVDTEERITTNPFVEGVLYSSSNASAWTVHQDSDMKFAVYGAKFNPEAVIIFDDIADVPADAILLMATTLTPSNTGSRWEVKIVMADEPDSVTLDDKEWEPIRNYVERELNGEARSLKLKTSFKANRNMSPIMSLHDLLLVSFLSELRGSYVTRTIDTREAPYNTVFLSVENFMPGNSKVTPRFSTDGGDTWQEFTGEPTVRRQTAEFNRYEYTERINPPGDGPDSIKFRLDMETQNSFVRPRSRRLMTRWTKE